MVHPESPWFHDNSTGAVSAYNSILYAKGVPCDTPLVIVDTDDGTLHRRICDIVASAIPRLAECQLKLTNLVTIGFSDKLVSHDGNCLGLYYRGKDRIELLQPRAFEQAHKASEEICAEVGDA